MQTDQSQLLGYSSDSDTEKLRYALEERELLQEQVLTLQLELAERDRQLQALEQELKVTNHDLSVALCLPCLSLTSAQELAKQILASNKSVHDSLAELLSGVYGLPVRSQDITPQLMPTLKLTTPSAFELTCSSTHNGSFKGENSELKRQLLLLRVLMANLKVQTQDLKARTQSVQFLVKKGKDF